MKPISKTTQTLAKIKEARQILNKQKQNTKKIITQNHSNWFCDFSTEELGYYTKKDKNGNILDVIRLVYPR